MQTTSCRLSATVAPLSRLSTRAKRSALPCLVRRISPVKLGDLYVLPRYRGEGVGRALVCAVAELARSRGAAHVHLTANLEALAFCDRLAFREESRNLAVRVDKLLSHSARA